MKSVHIKFILFSFLVFSFMGCMDIPIKEEVSSATLTQNKECIKKAQHSVNELMGDKKIFLSDTIFRSSNQLVLSTQSYSESFIEKDKLSKIFLLQKEKRGCYIGLVEEIGVKKRIRISCDCFTSI